MTACIAADLIMQSSCLKVVPATSLGLLGLVDRLGQGQPLLVRLGSPYSSKVGNVDGHVVFHCRERRILCKSMISLAGQNSRRDLALLKWVGRESHY
jgi:hypothetical protein